MFKDPCATIQRVPEGIEEEPDFGRRHVDDFFARVSVDDDEEERDEEDSEREDVDHASVFGYARQGGLRRGTDVETRARDSPNSRTRRR